MQNENIDDITLRAIEQYSKTIAPNEIIEEGNFNTNVDTIRDYVKDYIAVTNERPIIVIDYLQILTPSNTKLTDKQQTDYNVTTLKKISRDYDIPVIVISSFNRGGYNNTASFDQFKESGGIEYTADVLLTMQLKIVQDIADDKITNDIREKIRDAKQQIPREVQVVCLKNRSGKSNFSVNFNFNPVFNHFKEQQGQSEIYF